MKESVINFINKLEGFKTAIKNLHWSSSNMSEHKLFDDIAETFSNFQDEISEMEQGLHGQTEKNKLKPTSYTISNSKKFITDVLSDTKDFYSTIDDENYIGIRSAVENFIGELNKYQYLLTLTIKEEIVKRLKNEPLNEAFNSKKLDTLNRQHGGLDWGKYNASELTDDEIGDTFERGDRHFRSDHDITFKDGSGVHVNPTKAHRNINNGFHMTPDKEGYDRHMELTRRNHWSGRELPRDEYRSRNPHYNRLKLGFNNVEDGKHRLHHTWKDNFKPGEYTEDGYFMNHNGMGVGYGSYGGEEELGTGMNHRLSTLDHAKDWYNMKNMDRQQKRDYLERKYKGKLHPALYHDFENENTKKDMKNTIRLTEAQLHRVIKETVNRILKEGKFGKK